MIAGGPYAFFLGGHDLEMVTIKQLLNSEGLPVFDKCLTWRNALASAYTAEIKGVLDSQQTPVLIELRCDLDVPPDNWINVDHHGPLAGMDRPTCLHQIFQLLGLPPERWSRWYQLVAENDRGHVEAMRSAGASQAELIHVRTADRAAQGITEEEERLAEEALAKQRQTVGGNLTVVELRHARTATVTDRLHHELGGPGYQNLLIHCPAELDFFGEGSHVLALASAFPGGWYGGGLPKQGFWGHELPGISPSDVEHFLKNCISSSDRETD